MVTCTEVLTLYFTTHFFMTSIFERTYMQLLLQSMQRYQEHNGDTYTTLVSNNISDGMAYPYDVGIYYKQPMRDSWPSAASARDQQGHLKPYHDMLVHTTQGSSDRNTNLIRAQSHRKTVLEKISKHRLTQPLQRQEKHHQESLLENLQQRRCYNKCS